MGRVGGSSAFFLLQEYETRVFSTSRGQVMDKKWEVCHVKERLLESELALPGPVILIIYYHFMGLKFITRNGPKNVGAWVDLWS